MHLLGSTVPSDGHREAINRINQVKFAFNDKKGIFSSRNINLALTKQLVKALVYSVSLYVSEMWTLEWAEDDTSI